MRLSVSRLSAGFNSPTGSHRVRIFVRQYHDRRGQNVAGDRIDEKQKQKIRQMFKDGYSKSACARRFCVSPQSVTRALRAASTTAQLKGAE
jgi:DNA invertase Pin-like site-specific DNA recombinase